MRPLVSVVIPTFNRRRLLERAVESVLAQSFSDLELIVVDDGSTDTTPEFVSGLGPPVRCIRQLRRGPAAARNRGIRAARGEFVAFLDSDDWWEPEKLAVQIGAMRREPDFPISHTQELWFRRGELLPQKKKHRKHRGMIFDRCLPLCCVSLSTVVARKSLFDEVGPFDESLPCCEDYEMWLRVSARHPFLLVDRPLTLKDGGRPDQLSRVYRVGMDRFRIRALLKILGEPGLLSDEQRLLAARELSRKCRIYGEGCIRHGREDEGRYYLGLTRDSWLVARGS